MTVTSQKQLSQSEGNALDLALTERVRDRDRKAEQQLIERLRGQVRRTVFYLAGAHRDSDDLFQLALVEILYSAGTYRGDASLERWADRITVRTVLKALKKQRRRDRLHEEYEDVADDTNVVDTLDAQRVRVRLATLLQDLKAGCRASMVLHYVHGYPIQEVAALTGTKINTVRGHLKSGRNTLRRRIMADRLLREWAKKGGNR